MNLLMEKINGVWLVGAGLSEIRQLKRLFERNENIKSSELKVQKHRLDNMQIHQLCFQN